jgi:hypothetical protein
MKKNAYNRKKLSVPLMAVIFFCVLLAACAGPAVMPVRQIQWPSPPARPQVVWVSEISDYKDAGIRGGIWKRLVDFVVGESDQHIGRPYGVYADEHGRLFIVDTPLGIVHVMDAGKNSYSIIGQDTLTTVFKSPIAVIGDDSDNVYITDSAAGLVYRFNLRDSTLAPFIHVLQRPTGIAFNRRNRLLYVTDTTADQIAVFDLNGNERFRISGPNSAFKQFNHPTDLFIDSGGNLYVTDAMNARILVFSADGRFKRGFGKPGDSGSEFAKPKGVAVDSAGNVYVADAQSDTVKVFDAAGVFRFEFGGNGIDAGTFWMPSGVYIDSQDRIYVSDTYNRRVQLFRTFLPVAKAGEER